MLLLQTLVFVVLCENLRNDLFFFLVIYCQLYELIDLHGLLWQEGLKLPKPGFMLMSRSLGRHCRAELLCHCTLAMGLTSGFVSVDC